MKRNLLCSMFKVKGRVIDLRSDTLSKPTESMRKAMYKAEVGDDVLGEDPTVNALEQKSAAMLGKESGLFVPSSTMANLIAMMAHCPERGSEIIAGDKSHVYRYEQGGASQVGGIMMCIIPNKPDGTFDLQQMERMVRPDDIHQPVTSLVCIENTHNICGGKVLPLEWLEELHERTSRLGLPVHVDGARIFNAAVALGVPPARLVERSASMSFCISKGLGAPVGAVLVGSTPFIARSRRLRKVLGGGMRQAGVIAAAGLVALDEMVGRLADDHRRATAIGRAINDFKSKNYSVDVANLHTNIIFVKINPKVVESQVLADRLATVIEAEVKELGEDAVEVKTYALSNDSIRLVTYYEISDEDVNAAVKKLHYVFKECDKRE
ncbi:uncharacterized protein LOC134537610 isoform X2 [Bacillus rossius redtenbacheri]|uniref:uncharacterized protein LOC134537610 isoform X2 n=1 Tax=Bacillus rossius redtenbacheri TaxID=93214 RepID=UPI002FDD41C5